MPGPMPKPAALRLRRNRRSVNVLSASDAGRKAPPLPDGRKWHRLTREWWADVWASPVSRIYIGADRDGLLMLVVLVEMFWCEPSSVLAAEIRQAAECYGLSPRGRRRLEIIVEPPEPKAQEEREPEASGPDPREVLRCPHGRSTGGAP